MFSKHINFESVGIGHRKESTGTPRDGIKGKREERTTHQPQADGIYSCQQTKLKLYNKNHWLFTISCPLWLLIFFSSAISPNPCSENILHYLVN